MSEMEKKTSSLSNIPVVGNKLQSIHNATTGLRPTEDDSTAMKVAKRTAQGAIIVSAGALVAVAIL